MVYCYGVSGKLFFCKVMIFFPFVQANGSKSRVFTLLLEWFGGEVVPKVVFLPYFWNGLGVKSFQKSCFYPTFGMVWG